MVRQTVCKARSIPCGVLAVAIVILCSESAFAAATMESYISEVDGSRQQYGLHIPDPFDPDVPHPVVFNVHGYGGRANTNFPMQSFTNARGWIIVNLDGRGNTWYEGLGETDFFEVLRELRAQYLLDENRLYIEGCSMGGTGAYRLGFRFPHLFAAAGAVDGFADYRVYHRQAFASPSDLDGVDPRREPLLQSGSAFDIAENGKHLNLYMVVDQNDGVVLPENGVNLHARLNELNYDHSYNQYSGGHCSNYNHSLIYDFFAEQVNDPNPQDVVLKANELKYGSAYWVRIDRLERSAEFAMIRANARGGKEKDRVLVTASGLLQYTLFLTPELAGKEETSVYTNDQLTYAGRAGTITVSASLHEAGNVTGWSTENSLPRGLRKTAQIEGPIGHAYTTKFLLVWGTISKSNNRTEAEKFASEWNSWMHADISPVEDTSITEDDIATSNLILFGTADSNSIIQEINDLLPVRIWKERIVVGASEYVGENYGLYMIFPNPLNPERYVVISHGTVAGSYSGDLQGLPWYWPDYVVFDTSIVPSPTVRPPWAGSQQTVYHPEAWVEAGFFDQYWRLDKDEDGLDDIWEKGIVDVDPGDDIVGIADVNPTGDFDGDQQDNRTEYGAGTDPTSSDSFFSALSAKPDPVNGLNFLVSWKVARGRSYCILWADSAEGPWHEVAQLDPADVSDEGDIRTWADKGTDPAMQGKKPGDCPKRFYKVMAYR